MSNPQPIVFDRIYNAPASNIWEALTDREKMKQWYFDIADFKPEVGFEFSFSGGSEDKVFVHLCKITELVPGKKIAYSWRYEGYEGTSYVSFELFPEGGKTRLRLVHQGLESFPPIQDFARTNFEMGWTYILGTSLPKYLGEPAEKK